MPLYELRDNAENKIELTASTRNSVVVGGTAVAEAIIGAIAVKFQATKEPVRVAFDGWFGVDWAAVTAGLQAAAEKAAISLETFDAATLYRPQAELDDYKRPFITDDPGFGYVNDKGRIEDLMDRAKIQTLKTTLGAPASGTQALVVVGTGACAGGLLDTYDLVFYFDKTRQPLLWQMWDGKLASFGSNEPRKDYHWKEYYYCDFYLLEHQKNLLVEKLDYYVEAIDASDLKLVPRRAYDEIIQTLVKYPIKEIKIFQPGMWGAYRYKDFWNVPGLECNAWNELAGPELSILVEVDQGKVLNMPVTNLMQYPLEFVGKAIHEELPGMFPLDVWLDDGYFPTPQPAERISMPIHNHPSTAYVKKHFNEPLGRYETYYITEAYEGANTWMGFKEDADIEEWERLCVESERTGKPIPNWKDFIANWDSNVGDLYLIPPGTTHGHGGNQMVLEMDTVPSMSGTEYSFFTYDYCRPSWDDKTKTMTAKPVKMHLDHGFAIDQGRRENWVKSTLRATPKIIKWTKEYSIDRYSSYGPMPFEIERIHFSGKARYSTEGKFMHIPTLTIGKRVAIRSVAHPERSTEIDLFQSAVIPAGFGEYEVESLNGGYCTLTLIRWKKG